MYDLVYNMHKIDILNWCVTILTVSGGVLFTAGSVVYLPSLSYINPSVGGILFIIGSAFFFTCDILAVCIEP